MADIRRFSRVDYWSLAAFQIKVYRDDIFVSHGTAFLYEFAGEIYLVTAWHVLSGRHFQTKKNLSSKGVWPNWLEIKWPLGAPLCGDRHVTNLQIRDEDDEALWLEDPDVGSDVDVALLPVNLSADAIVFPINKLPEGHLELGMGQDLFVLGFPMVEQPLDLPIWKRASLASEPAIPEGVQHYWLVDTASRSGMSGAPVIQRAYNYELSTDDFMARISNPGHKGKSRFVGLYSGRFRLPVEDDGSALESETVQPLQKQAEELQLGIVWPSWCIIRIIKGHIGSERYDAELRRQAEAMHSGAAKATGS